MRQVIRMKFVKIVKTGIMLLALACAILLMIRGKVAEAQSPTGIGEQPILEQHTNEADIENGSIKLKKLRDIGETIFSARWSKLDGQGRPGATGNSNPTHRNPSNDPGFIRTSGTDSTSCADCHNQPAVGGAGGFVSNVFVLAQNLEPATDSVSPQFSDERNTLGMNGSGAIELLAREMTADLLSIQAAASTQAKSSGADVSAALTTKGVNFGQIIAHPEGSFDMSGIQGIDPDLIVKPFSQKGVVNSLRVFSVNAFNQHHGMEAVERFGVGELDSSGRVIMTNDFDGDGVPDELSIGDITTAVVYQAALNTPGRVVASDPSRRKAAQAGEELFSQIGCSVCHIPTLTLNSPIFSEPNPYNPAGNYRVRDAQRPFTFDLTKDISKPRLESGGNGTAIVHPYTDLKRHVIADAQDPYFANEQLIQNGVPLDQFITRKLWDVGSSAPYGHRGDLTTMTEAIMHHAGEARPQREHFAALSPTEQAEIIEFLKQLQVLPDGSPRQVTEDELAKMLKAQKHVKASLLLNRERK